MGKRLLTLKGRILHSLIQLSEVVLDTHPRLGIYLVVGAVAYFVIYLILQAGNGGGGGLY